MKAKKKNVIAIILEEVKDHDYIHWQKVDLSLQCQLGKYRLVDIPISNCMNSDIKVCHWRSLILL
jgi:ADP-glucose pyrophosphorylase